MSAAVVCGYPSQESGPAAGTSRLSTVIRTVRNYGATSRRGQSLRVGTADGWQCPWHPSSTNLASSRLADVLAAAGVDRLRGFRDGRRGGHRPKDNVIRHRGPIQLWLVNPQGGVCGRQLGDRPPIWFLAITPSFSSSTHSRPRCDCHDSVGLPRPRRGPLGGLRKGRLDFITQVLLQAPVSGLRSRALLFNVDGECRFGLRLGGRHYRRAVVIQ